MAELLLKWKCQVSLQAPLANYNVLPCVLETRRGRMYIIKVVKAFHVYGWQTTVLDVQIHAKSRVCPTVFSTVNP